MIRSKNPIRRFAGKSIALAVLSVCVSGVAAQDLRPPQPEKEPEAPIFLTFASVVLLTGAVIATALIPSKRGHQD
ncbi:MAG: hypothetical protein AAGI53_01885 [Planctomycetota bacterium]